MAFAQASSLRHPYPCRKSAATVEPNVQPRQVASVRVGDLLLPFVRQFSGIEQKPASASTGPQLVLWIDIAQGHHRPKRPEAVQGRLDCPCSRRGQADHGQRTSPVSTVCGVLCKS